MHDSAWSKDLTVEVAGHGIVSHTGSAALRLVADNTGLTAGLSRALARRGFTPVHDRGRVLSAAPSNPVDTVVPARAAGAQPSSWGTTAQAPVRSA